MNSSNNDLLRRVKETSAFAQVTAADRGKGTRPSRAVRRRLDALVSKALRRGLLKPEIMHPEVQVQANGKRMSAELEELVLEGQKVQL